MGGIMRYGEVVHRARKVLRLTLDGVGRRIKSQKGYISGIENGTVNPPSLKVTKRLAKALKLNVDSMLFHAVIEKAPAEIQQALREKLADLLYNEKYFDSKDE